MRDSQNSSQTALATIAMRSGRVLEVSGSLQQPQDHDDGNGGGQHVAGKRREEIEPVASRDEDHLFVILQREGDLHGVALQGKRSGANAGRSRSEYDTRSPGRAGFDSTGRGFRRTIYF